MQTVLVRDSERLSVVGARSRCEEAKSVVAASSNTPCQTEIWDDFHSVKCGELVQKRFKRLKLWYDVML